jgi:hypothetical protein
MSFYKITRCSRTTKAQPFVMPYIACELVRKALREKGIPSIASYALYKPHSRSIYESKCPECLERHKLNNCACKDDNECIEKMPIMIFRYFNKGTEIGMKCVQGCTASSILSALFDSSFIKLT